MLLRFDEAITGFRIALGGCQGHYGITPDLATYGKALAAGAPIGTVAGRGDVINCCSGNGDAAWIFSSGTFNGNPLSYGRWPSCHAHDGGRQRTLVSLPHAARQLLGSGGQCLLRRAQIRRPIDEHRLHVPSALPKLAHQRLAGHNASGPLGGARVLLHLLGYGVIILGIHLAFISAAHKPEDAGQIIHAFKRSFMNLWEGELLQVRSV